MDDNGDICIETKCPGCTNGMWTPYKKHYITKEYFAGKPEKCGLCEKKRFVKQLTRYPFSREELNNVVLDEVEER